MGVVTFCADVVTSCADVVTSCADVVTSCADVVVIWVGLHSLTISEGIRGATNLK